ncbi:MAG: GNAT family N-acetyltransferase [Chloroflexota bacterium]|nr:GNAT family N-acetyltransferase [Chloroflexota bacterium]
MTSGRLRTHQVTLRSGLVTLRPLTEDDWELVAGWWNDPEIAYYADADDGEYTLAQVQEIVRGISQKAYCFVIEFEGWPVGECWLQEMNVQRILDRNPGLDCRRVPLENEKAYWGRGIGTATIRLLVEFGFESERADAIFAMEIADYNTRSRRAFERAGFELYDTVAQPAGARARVRHDLVIWSKRHIGRLAAE